MEAFRPPWQKDANCKGLDTNLFYLESRERISPIVKETCKNCKVKTECLDFSIENEEVHGIWAGLNPRRRRRVARHRLNEKNRNL